LLITHVHVHTLLLHMRTTYNANCTPLLSLCRVHANFRPSKHSRLRYSMWL
jgi:hypothetical protein